MVFLDLELQITFGVMVTNIYSSLSVRLSGGGWVVGCTGAAPSLALACRIASRHLGFSYLPYPHDRAGGDAEYRVSIIDAD